MNDISIGIDFDNTIVCYDSVFYQTAMEQKNPETPKNEDGYDLRVPNGVIRVPNLVPKHRRKELFRYMVDEGSTTH